MFTYNDAKKIYEKKINSFHLVGEQENKSIKMPYGLFLAKIAANIRHIPYKHFRH